MFGGSGPRVRKEYLLDTCLNITIYFGSPSGKNFHGDVALVQEIAKEFAATQLRQDTFTATTKPGVIMIKKVEQEIKSRIEEHNIRSGWACVIGSQLTGIRGIRRSCEITSLSQYSC